MDKNDAERIFFHELCAGKYHPCHPKIYDIPGGRQNVGRIKCFQIFCNFRPAQSGERPKSGRKPSVQNVSLPGNRNPVSPPDLSGNAPIFYVFQPVKINFLESSGNKFHLPAFYRFDCLIGENIHFQEPLFGGNGFDQRMTPVAIGQRMDVIFGLFDQIFFLKFCENFFPALQSFQSFADFGLF